jgi:hypothetical protein
MFHPPLLPLIEDGKYLAPLAGEEKVSFYVIPVEHAPYEKARG